MSFPFVVLTAFLMPFCILASWTSIHFRLKEYLVAFLVLETMMIGVFCALDIILFYLFFEGGLIPMFLIIGIWGGKRRIYASFKFFLYTLTGSLLMLLAIMSMYGVAGTTDITVLLKTHFPASMQTWLWLAFFASFAVKMPMWPVHTWLPDAHVEAPTAGSVILAGVLLKMGGYGFLRFSLPMFPDASVTFAPLVFTLSVIAIIYTSLVALVQEDMKKLIAYSSVAHMGFVTMGLFTFTEQGIQGAIFQMVSHGIVSSALFLCVGVDLRPHAHARDRRLWRPGGAHAALCRGLPDLHHGERRSARHVGLRRRVPDAARRVPRQQLGGAVSPRSASSSRPPTRSTSTAASSSACWTRTLKSILDLNGREIALLVPLVLLTILYGVHPAPILDSSAASVSALVKTHEAAIAPANKLASAMPTENSPQ